MQIGAPGCDSWSEPGGAEETEPVAAVQETKAGGYERLRRRRTKARAGRPMPKSAKDDGSGVETGVSENRFSTVRSKLASIASVKVRLVRAAKVRLAVGAEVETDRDWPFESVSVTRAKFPSPVNVSDSDAPVI